MLSNPIGADGADALIAVFEQNTNLRTLLGIEEGVTELTLSNKKVDPGQAKILAAELKSSRAVAVLASLTLSGNKISGTKRERGQWIYDADLSGFTSLCRRSSLTCCNVVPPTPWTIHLGAPVVPLENKI